MMVHTKKLQLVEQITLIAVLIGLVAFAGSSALAEKPDAAEAKQIINLERPLGSEGTVSFKITVPQTYRVGADSPKKDIPILRIPGVASYRLHQSDPEPHDPNVIKLTWLWESDNAVNWTRKFVPEIPGPRTYYVQYSWDTEKGLIEACIDGNPIRVPGTKLWKTWSMDGVGEKIVIPESEIEVSNVKVEHQYLPTWRLQAMVPDEYRGRTPEIWGLRADTEALDVSDRKGELLYSADMDDPADIADWPEIEGPGKVKIDDGWMHMWSPGKEGHHVFWCPEDFPDSFVAEWEIKLLSRRGLCLTFFAAKGREKGRDIFDPALPERDGTFTQYARGAIQAYHTSYFAGPGRVTSNLRKDGEFYLMDQGPIAIYPSPEIHTVRLIKDEGHIQLQVDGKVYIDYTDDNEERFGPRYHDGKIGFRQMQATEGLYRNFQVWELKQAE